MIIQLNCGLIPRILTSAMFRTLIRNVVLVSMIPALIITSVYAQSKPEWQKFVSPDGQFSVLFPRKPSTNTQTEKSAKGKSTIYSVTSFERLFYFGVEQINSDYDMDDDKRIEALRDHLLTQFGARLVSQSEIELNGYKGIEMVAIDSERGLKGKILVSGRSSYVVLLSTPYSADGNEEQIDKFLKSFEILKPVK
jgi:hypothetical protein